jgi:hypothetical protein
MQHVLVDEIGFFKIQSQNDSLMQNLSNKRHNLSLIGDLAKK